MTDRKEPPTEEVEEDDSARKGRRVQLDWKDYLALSIAALETVLLPMIMIIIVLLVLIFVIR